MMERNGLGLVDSWRSSVGGALTEALGAAADAILCEMPEDEGVVPQFRHSLHLAVTQPRWSKLHQIYAMHYSNMKATSVVDQF